MATISHFNREDIIAFSKRCMCGFIVGLHVFLYIAICEVLSFFVLCLDYKCSEGLFKCPGTVTCVDDSYFLGNAEFDVSVEEICRSR